MDAIRHRRRPAGDFSGGPAAATACLQEAGPKKPVAIAGEK
jgi:hypothetical protein